MTNNHAFLKVSSVSDKVRQKKVIISSLSCWRIHEL